MKFAGNNHVLVNAVKILIQCEIYLLKVASKGYKLSIRFHFCGLFYPFVFYILICERMLLFVYFILIVTKTFFEIYIYFECYLLLKDV